MDDETLCNSAQGFRAPFHRACVNLLSLCAIAQRSRSNMAIVSDTIAEVMRPESAALRHAVNIVLEQTIVRTSSDG